MAPKSLTVEEMNQISEPLVAEGNPARAALEKIPLLAALLPQLQAVHAGIVAVRPPQDDPRAREISGRLAALDLEHDTRVRGIHGALTGLAQVSTAGSELLALRDELYPQGLGHTQMTFRGEAGHAAAIATRMDTALEARLKAVNLHDRNLLDLVHEWQSVAKQMGQLEEERARLMPGVPAAGEILKARLAWVRVMNALVANAELAATDETTDRLLFGPLRAAEKAAANRGKAKPVEAPTTPAVSTPGH
jgi:hypothetical protein